MSKHSASSEGDDAGGSGYSLAIGDIEGKGGTSGSSVFAGKDCACGKAVGVKAKCGGGDAPILDAVGEAACATGAVGTEDCATAQRA